VLGKRDLHHETREGIDLSPFLGEFVREKRKPNFGNVIGQRKNSPQKSWISFYSFTCRFARANSPSGKRHSTSC
jgi:hypothetical protein